MPSYFHDEGFLDSLLSVVVRDRSFAREFGTILVPEDFPPKLGTDGFQRFTLATVALDYFQKYQEPVGDLLNVELRQHAQNSNLSEKNLKSLLGYAAKLKNLKTPIRPISDKVVAFKREALKAKAIDEILDLHGQGKLTDSKWLELCREAVDFHDQRKVTLEHIADLETRILRRKAIDKGRYPLLFIDPLDRTVKALSRGGLGLIIAPYKRGKSLALLYIAVAYLFQGLNVLYFTLEDPKQDTEDRADSIITMLPIKALPDRPNSLRKRMGRFASRATGRLKIVDGTSDGLSMPEIENAFLFERDRGFSADAVIIDYDDEVRPTKKQQERRFELADIYRDMRKLAARSDTFLWTAAQTKRNTSHLKVLNGDAIAEDISKVRKAAIALSLGKGDWGDDSIYLYVVAHKYDRKEIGWNIATDLDRMLIYDRDKTMKKERENSREVEPEEEVDV